GGRETDPSEKGRFEVADRLAGGGDPLFEVSELGRDETLGADKGLFALVPGRDEGGVRLADLDVVAEYPVESDAQRPDAGALALRRLEGGDRGPDVAGAR